MLWLGVAGAAVLAIAVAAYMFRGGSTPEQPSPSPEPSQAQAAAGGDALPTPPAGGDQAAAVQPPSAPPAGAPAASGGAKPAGASAAGAGTAAAVKPPTAGAQAPATGTAAVAPGAATVTAKPADDPLVTFPDVKLYQVTGKRAADKDAVLNFSAGQLLVMPNSGGAAMATLPYKRITHATYVKARDPKWSTGFAAPPDDLDVGSFVRTPRHWLVLQGADHFEILRLDDKNFSRVLDTFEARTGLKIDRQK